MINLCLAELRKLLRHYALVLFTLALPSVAVFLGSLLQVVFMLAVPQSRATYTLQTNWLDSLLLPWDFVAGQASTVGRLFPLVFMAAACGSEYQSGMWKNLLPGQTRLQVLLAKILVMLGLAWAAFALMSVVALAGNSLVAAVLAQPGFWPAAGEDAWGQLFTEWPRYYFLLLLSFVILAWIAMLMAMTTRSVIGALIGGILFSVFETLYPGFVYLAASITNNDAVLGLMHLAPSNCLLNLHSWWTFNQAYGSSLSFSRGIPELSATGSLFILLAWAGVLTALTFWRFQTQDIVE